MICCGRQYFQEFNCSNYAYNFYGYPDFAVESLKALLESGYNVVAVVTTPDKPAGRGQKIHQSPVKVFATQHNIPVLQPEKLRNPEFLEQLKSYNADIQVVVAFRMLPEVVWNMPPMGTINVHASLLPQYRGAAPINHTIINGEKRIRRHNVQAATRNRYRSYTAVK
ncbi:methionyl-tRNA formyltransferase [Sphingobacterium sp. T2]|uniref:methionyl-tRNA formyltransferase n=1 Tax=Sphingobacterium sp. T2 TaxID=1590596 RepID=UPI002934F92E|nr:methionyl-tRNA formyltransferase [Sphingobacterium sp. T2]